MESDPVNSIIFYSHFFTSNGSLENLSDIILVPADNKGNLKRITKEGIRKRISKIREAIKTRYYEEIL